MLEMWSFGAKRVEGRGGEWISEGEERRGEEMGVGCWMLDAGCWYLVFGIWLFVVFGFLTFLCFLYFWFLCLLKGFWGLRRRGLSVFGECEID